MSFSQVCVMIVLWIIIAIGGIAADNLTNTDGCISFIVSSVGFAVCLTLLLIKHGVI